MMDVFYIGNLYTVAEYIFYNDNYKLKGIICEEDRVNDNILTFSIVRDIPIYKVNRKNPIEKIINSISNDIIFIMCSYGRRVPVEKCADYMIFNIHYAALPNYKGRHPTYWATLNNEKFLGISIHIVTENFDQGDIIAQKMVPYYIWENETDIFEKMTKEVPSLLESLCGYLVNYEKKIIIPNMEGGYYRPVEQEDITLDLVNDSLPVIFNKVRSQSRANGAKIIFHEKKFIIFDALFTKKNINSEYMIDDKLYIRINKDICLTAINYKEII